MKVELLYIDDCPSSDEIGVRLREAIDRVGLPDVSVESRRIAADADAAATPQFAGSPTVLIDGEDPFPSGGHAATLACRVYLVDGVLAGMPSVAQLEVALRGRV